MLEILGYFGAGVGGLLIGLLIMFLFLKNNPKYLVQSLQKDVADAQSVLDKVESQMKIGISTAIPSLSVPIARIVPIVESAVKKDASEVLADIKKLL